MLNFDFVEKDLGTVSLPPPLLSDQISLSYSAYFLMYWAICVLQLFVS